MIERKFHLSVLILERDSDDLHRVVDELKRAGLAHDATEVVGEPEFLVAVERKPDVILASCDAAGFGAREVLRLLEDKQLDIPLIVIGGSESDTEAHKCMELGAADCLLKDDLARLGPVVVRAHLEHEFRRGSERAAVELRESRSRFQAVWQYSMEPMRLTNRDGIIQAVNAPYCSLVGMTEKELLGQPFTVVYSDREDCEVLGKAHWEQFEKGGTVLQEENRKCFANRDREIDVEVSLNRIRVEEGEDLLLLVMRDISEKKELEARFLRTQRMECIGTLAGGVAHDLNNILSPILMAGSMLRMELSAADREKAISTIEKSGQRGADNVGRLLQFARGIEGEKKPIEPGELFRDVAAIVERSFPRNIRLEVAIAPDLWTVTADRTQLHQVILNLCLNARDAMPEGGTLLLEARNQVVTSEGLPQNPQAKSGTYVVASVTDTGVGIAPEDQERVFDPFFTTKPENAGTGLGLSTSLGIIKNHSGFITMKSDDGKGSRFDVYLPVSSTLAVKPEEAPAKDNASGGSGEVVLVVDDEKLVLEVMSKVLRKCGYRTLMASSGAEGLDLLSEAEGEIGVIVSDLIMPEMDGLDFLSRVREKHPDVPAIAMSGNVDQEFLEALADVGVTEVIDKPFRADQLLKIVGEVLEPPAGIERE